MGNSIKQRVIWIDWAKAILIYLMVVGHCLPAPWQGTLIYAFHMPAFFMISGYLFHEHHWWKTMKSFVVPVAFFSMINFVIYLIPKLAKGTFSSVHLLEKVLVPFWGPGSLPADDYIILFPGVWFIIALLLGRLLMGDLKMMSWVTKYWKQVFCILIMFLTLEPWLIPDNPLRSYKFYLVIPSLPFMLLGYGMKDWFKVDKIKPWMALIGCAAFVAISLFYGRAEILKCQYGNYYILYFLNAVLGSVVFFYISSKFRRNYIIEIFSKGTLLILAFNIVLHSYISAAFTAVGFGFIVNEKNLFPWFEALLIMLICYWPIKWMLNKYPVLLGK